MRLVLLALVMCVLAACAQPQSTDNTIDVAAAETVPIEEAAPTAQVEQQESQPVEPTPKPVAETAPQVNTATNYKEGIKLTEFPASVKKEFTQGRYKISFAADSEVRFTMYEENRYQEWQQSGTHTLSKLTTKKGSTCCTKDGEWTIDINNGEEGTYYFVFDLGFVETGPESATISVRKI